MQGFNTFHPVGIEFPLVTATHKRQYFIAAALQRDMKMGHETVAVGHQVDNFIIQQVGLDGRNTEPGYFLYLIQRLGEFKKIFRFFV